VFGVEAAQRSLEDVATPLSAEGEEHEGERRGERRPGTPRRRARSQLAYVPQYPMSSRSEDDEDVDREVEELVRALEAGGGTMRRGALGDAVNCRYWGPGRYRAALRTALEEGRIRKVGRDTYAAS
jgi:hypothetical protein